jgi:hypothetical protein
MITHQIKVYHETPARALRDIPVSERPHFVAGSNAHRDYIRNTTVARSKQLWMLDQYVQLKHSNSDDCGVVTAVYSTESEGLRWSNMKCRPVEVYWYHAGTCEVYHPDELVEWKGE